MTTTTRAVVLIPTFNEARTLCGTNMLLTVHNITSEPVSVGSGREQQPKDTPIPAFSTASVSTRARFKAKLRLQGKDRVCELKAFGLATRALKRWSLLYDEGDEFSGWRVYLLRVGIGPIVHACRWTQRFG